MTHRQPKFSSALRTIAAGCIVLWLQASSHCALERLFGDDHQPAEAGASETLVHHDIDRAHEAEGVKRADGETSHQHDSDQPSQDSHHHNGSDTCCCSTLMATAQIITPFVFVKPVLEPLDILRTVLQPRDLMLAAPGDKAERQAKDRDEALMPEVCLDPAHRSLAPPSLV